MSKGRPKIDYWHEFVMTFSEKKSLFSSKKIERFIVFWVFLTLTIIYLSINMRELEAWDFVEITALWLIYGGYNSLMTLRDKRLPSSQEVEEEGNIEEGFTDSDINPDPKTRRKTRR
jgi:hypothetical protein